MSRGSRGSTRRGAPSGALAGLVTVAVLLAGCGGGAATQAPTPTPVVTVAPTPSPTPDVKAAFLALLAQKSWSAKATLSGEMAVGTLKAKITGNGVYSGKDSRSDMTISVAGVDQVQSQVRIGDTDYSKSGSGPWVKKPAKTGSASLTAQLALIQSIEDLGVEAKGGQQLHHLKPSGATLTPDAFGFDDPSLKDPTVAVDFYVTDDGTFRIMSMSAGWTQQVGAAPTAVTISIDFTFSDIGTPQSITAPSDAWTERTSVAFGYTMAAPENWTVKSSAEQDTYLLNGVEFGYVTPLKADGMTLDKVRDAVIAGYLDQLGSPAQTTPATIGGEPGVKLLYRFDSTGGKSTALDVLVVHAGKAWEISFLTTPEAEAQDLPYFDQFLSTFRFN